MEIYLIRHGQTYWNAEGKMQGKADIELNESGREVAGRKGEQIEDVPIDCIFSSPLIRAYETACLLRGHRNIPIVRDARLEEICFGIYEGRRAKELLEDQSDTFRFFFTEPEKYIPPAEGERFEDVIARAANFMQEVIEPLDGKMERVMIVGHGALNQGIMSYVKQKEVRDYWADGLQQNCGINIISYNKDGYQVLQEENMKAE